MALAPGRRTYVFDGRGGLTLCVSPLFTRLGLVFFACQSLANGTDAGTSKGKCSLLNVTLKRYIMYNLPCLTVLLVCQVSKYKRPN